MSAKQRDLFGLDQRRRVQPSPDRRSPTLWVRRLRVLRELGSGDLHVVRDVELRRGFNVVWAPSQGAGEGNALFKDGVAGHTAGKSTFCRLLRHVLGEPGFAPEAVRRAIRQKLPTGWVVAEVVVGDESWVVARPLSIGPHSFCIRGGSLDLLAEPAGRRSYAEFLQAVAATTVDRLPAARFPANDDPVRWEHLLPWLSRDQECRFADFLEWRHAGSGSEAPSLTVDERQFLVRSVLGLISDAERVEQQANAKLVAQRKEALRFEPLLRHRAETDHSRVAKALSIEPGQPGAPLFASVGRAEIEKRKVAVEKRERQVAATDRRDDLRKALEQAVSHEAKLRQRLDQAQGQLDLQKRAIEALLGKTQSDVLAGLPPPRDFCGVPLSLARERQCPLATNRPASLAAVRGERSAQDNLATQQVVAEAIEREIASLREAFRVAEGNTRTARHAFLAESTAYDNSRAELLRDHATLVHLSRVMAEAVEAVKQAAEQVDAISRLDREIDDSYARQAAIRATQQAAVDRFSRRFDYVVRAILGEQVVGRVDATGRSLSLVVEEHGERDSAAIATIRLLAFDFAALVSSIEGDGVFPRFLIHDGPREADLSPDIYERLFLLSRELEQGCGEEPSFQYILTTTTRPPDPFVAAPWLRLQLAGAPAEQRLLRCDL